MHIVVYFAINISLISLNCKYLARLRNWTIITPLPYTNMKKDGEMIQMAVISGGSGGTIL